MMAWLVDIKNIIDANPIILGLMGGGVLATISYQIFKYLSYIGKFLKYIFISELYVTSEDRRLYRVLDDFLNDKIVNKSKYKNKLHVVTKESFKRKDLMYSGGYTGNSVMLSGYNFTPMNGTFIFWYKMWPYFVTKIMIDKTVSMGSIRYAYTLSTFGFTNKRLKKLYINLMEQTEKENADCVSVYVYNDGVWDTVAIKQKRNLESVFLSNNQLDNIISDFKKFYNSKDYYLERGIPYKMGCLMYGEPGCGKSSLIHVLASYFNKDIYYLLLNKLDDLVLIKALSMVNNGIIVVEDSDSFKSLQKRKDGNDEITLNNNKKNEEIFGVTLSTVLNVTDGLLCNDESVIIFTTNHINKLDPALLRQGRIDHKYEIKKLDCETIKKMITTYYPNIDDININPDIEIIPSKLQDILVQNNDKLSIIDKINYEYEKERKIKIEKENI